MPGRSGGGRIPSLDGIRAISIAMVLLGHLQSTDGFPALTINRWLGDLAHLGVIVFFILSGFLITSLLMQERARTGSVSLKLFYVRRILRIFPAFYIYIFIVAMIIAGGLDAPPINGADIGYALTYTVNYYPGRSWNIGHLWSLSVEEQFYLLWPLCFVLLCERRALAVAVITFALGPLVRALMHLVFHAPSPWRDLEVFPAMADNIAIGCIFALLRPWLLAQDWYLQITSSPWLALGLPLVFLINRMLDYTVIDLVGSPIMLVCLTVLIEASTRHGQSRAGRFLNWKPVVFVGLISYSLYLWQQPFLDRHAHLAMTAFPLNIVLAVAMALLSYFVVERSFLKVRRNYEHRRNAAIGAAAKAAASDPGGS